TIPRLSNEISAFISFAPRPDEHGFLALSPRHSLHYDPLREPDGSRRRSDLVRDRAPFDSIRWPAAGPPTRHRSNRANEKHVLMDPSHVKRSHRFHWL